MSLWRPARERREVVGLDLLSLCLLSQICSAGRLARKQHHQFDRRPFRPLQMMYEGRFVGWLGWFGTKSGLIVRIDDESQSTTLFYFNVR
jgi:hypothetical protein